MTGKASPAVQQAAIDLLRAGTVIPAHPLALTAERQLDERRQRALTRYYLDAGSGGLAVGVHTTQFAIREAGLYDRVLSLAAETAAQWSDRQLVMIAGPAGPPAQEIRRASCREKVVRIVSTLVVPVKINKHKLRV